MTTSFPVPGSVCRALPHRVGVASALVLVVGHLNEAITRIRLLSNETEMATESDDLLGPCPPVRPYRLLVHDFPGYLRTGDLGPPLSVVDLDRDLHPAEAPPLYRRTDPRWGWKIYELGRLQALQPPLAEVLGE